MSSNKFTLENVIIPSVHPQTRWDLEVADKQLSLSKLTSDPPGSDLAPPQLLLPSLCHPHIHLDKAYLLTSNHPPTDSIRNYSDLALLHGGFEEALGKSYEAKHRYTPEDLYLRGRQLVADCFRHGVTTMRAFVEVDSVTQFKTLEAAIRLKREFSHVVRMQICVFAQGPLFSGTIGLCNKKVLARALDEYAGEIEALGTTPYVEADEDAAVDNIRWAIKNAMNRELFLDFHLDYHLRSSKGGGAMMIQTVLELLIQTRWTTHASKSKQAVAIGHCTRLTTLEPSELRELQTRITKHMLPVHFVGLPTSDLLMMGRPLPGGQGDDRPFSRPRGTLQVVSMIKEWGLNACLGINNVGNPFTPHGDGDPLQLACWGVGLYHAGTVDDAELLYQCVSERAMRAVGFDPEDVAEEVSGIRDLDGVPYPGLLVENAEYDELPAAGGTAAGVGILVPARRRLGIKDVVWDPPRSRRIVRYESKPDPPDGKRHRGSGSSSAEEPPAKKVDIKSADASDSSP
ncbi:Cytosine deaminase [Cytospora mali]|uniref:Cytosine deaminase n=1 Tax=Cytospora mali TaxID=578113 RepID=A0A194WCR4_CYTMA|nr:Cytosine deaminase [Valsa mali]